MKSLFIINLLLLISTQARGEIQVLNLDFGNSQGSIVEGVLGTRSIGSPGGDYWNKISVDSYGYLSGGYELKDEFGNDIEAYLYGWSLYGWFWDSIATDIPIAPYADGIEAFSSEGPAGSDFTSQLNKVLEADEFSTLIVSGVRPGSEVALYFGSISGGQFAHDIASSPLDHFGNPSDTELFLYGYEYFPNPTISNSTNLGPPRPGVVLHLLEGSTLLAMQIKGEFSFVPEPTSSSLLLLSIFGVIGQRGIYKD